VLDLRSRTIRAAATRRSTICRPWRMRRESWWGCDPESRSPPRNRGNSTFSRSAILYADPV
jgi:hypothetical protein